MREKGRLIEAIIPPGRCSTDGHPRLVCALYQACWPLGTREPTQRRADCIHGAHPITVLAASRVEVSYREVSDAT